MSKPLLVIGNKNYSTWSLRGWLAMRKSGADFDERLLLLDTHQFTDEIGDLSPTARVPVLWHESRCIWDSYAIAEYANEYFAGGTLWPDDPAIRGWARAICAEMHSGFTALRNAMPMNLRAKGRVVPVDHQLQTDINRIFSIWRECRSAHSAKGPWLFGSFSIADVMYAPVAMRFPTYGVELPDIAQDYLTTLLTDPAMVEWIDAALAETEIVEPDEAGRTQVQ
jgi:glutathione S-transferase